jgi:hypothetical protein
MVCKKTCGGLAYALRFVHIKGLKRQLQAFSYLEAPNLPELKSAMGLAY